MKNVQHEADSLGADAPIPMEARGPGIEATLQLYERYAEQMRTFQIYASEPTVQLSASTSTTLFMK